ncbi:MAG: ABC transporter permease [Blautia sp.]|nr:ABC transporter permease [Blautia sp.]MCM1200823.1 ABC transporter permease [Bacteroides fragilis]
MILYKHEMKINRKSLLIWTLSIGAICFGCILLYTSLEDSIQEIAASFSDLGSMSAALGMDKMSLATLKGYYATEIAMMHSLGGAMFAAVLGTGLLAKEESGHTAEFLCVLPIGRSRIVFEKYLALASNIVVLNLACTGLYFLAFLAMGEEAAGKGMALYHLAAVLMQLEIGTICFFLSACAKKGILGAGLGLTLLLFAADMMCRVVPAIEGLRYITPFYYANAADIFTEEKINGVMAAAGAGVIVFFYAAADRVYCRKDLF